MRVYADTSFLVSWLYARDLNHSKAAAWFAVRQADQWIVSPWSEFETVNTLRSLCLLTPGPSPESVEAIRRYFKHLLRQGRLKRENVVWSEVLRDAHQISAALAARQKARAADILHVAILEQITSDVFVTFDKDQAALATQRGFHSVRVR